MRYSISEPVNFEEATPRGLLRAEFPAGVVDAEPGTDEHFVIEYVLIPAGYAEPVSDKPKRPTKAEREAAKAEAEKAEVDAPEDVKE